MAFVAPDGTRYESGADIATDRVYLVQDADTRGTYFAVKDPEPGSWRIEPLPGASPPPATTARRCPRRDRARVRGHTLVVRVRHRAGARVTFVERGRRPRKRIGTVARDRARLRFSPAAGPRGRRAILALVQRDGLPVGGARKVARSTPAARCGRGVPRACA